jgi:hypothetical protein
MRTTCVIPGCARYTDRLPPNSWFICPGHWPRVPGHMKRVIFRQNRRIRQGRHLSFPACRRVLKRVIRSVLESYR